MTDSENERELETCSNCGREGVPERIRGLPCPHVGLEHRINPGP